MTPEIKEQATPVNKTINDHSAEGFISSVFKYSISAILNVIIMGLSIILMGRFFTKEVLGQISLFTSWTVTIMTLAILGMDKALIRFYLKPPARISSNGLFRLCFYFSSVILLIAGAVCSTALQIPVYKAIGFENIGMYVLPLLFLNAYFYMIARYFNVLYRMEGNILVYTIESILMQFFLRLFYILGFFISKNRPVEAMVICSVLGFGAFSLIFSFLRRSVLRPQKAEFTSGAYKTIIPYGLEIAPTAVLLTANISVTASIITKLAGLESQGIYSFVVTLSNIVTVVQAGFASFWGPYMFANYKTQQERIKKVHDYLNLAVLVFFCLLIAFENVAFFIFPEFAEGLRIFPLTMLGAVFTILCETTVYGNEIAKKPILDTIGFAISIIINVALCFLLIPYVGLYGAAIAYAAGNFGMFIFRTFTGQKLYRSINNYAKTAIAILIAIVLAILGTVFAYNFILKLIFSLVTAVIYCIMYSAELKELLSVAISMLRKLSKKEKV